MQIVLEVLGQQGQIVIVIGERSVDVVVLAEILADRLDLGRRLDDDNLHALQSLNAFILKATGRNGAAAARPVRARKMVEAARRVKWAPQRRWVR